MNSEETFQSHLLGVNEPVELDSAMFKNNYAVGEVSLGELDSIFGPGDDASSDSGSRVSTQIPAPKLSNIGKLKKHLRNFTSFKSLNSKGKLRELKESKTEVNFNGGLDFESTHSETSPEKRSAKKSITAQTWNKFFSLIKLRMFTPSQKTSLKRARNHPRRDSYGSEIQPRPLLQRVQILKTLKSLFRVSQLSQMLSRKDRTDLLNLNRRKSEDSILKYRPKWERTSVNCRQRSVPRNARGSTHHFENSRLNLLRSLAGKKSIASKPLPNGLICDNPRFNFKSESSAELMLLAVNRKNRLLSKKFAKNQYESEYEDKCDLESLMFENSVCEDLDFQPELKI